MEKEIISDALLTQELENVFGIGNVASADSGQGYHAVYFRDNKSAAETLKVLVDLGFEDNLLQDEGGFVSTLRPNVWILCGNEHQRSNGKNPDLHEAAIKILAALRSNKEILQAAAGMGAAPSRA